MSLQAPQPTTSCFSQSEGRTGFTVIFQASKKGRGETTLVCLENVMSILRIADKTSEKDTVAIYRLQFNLLA